ncbi:MAG: Lrp/AsnC family transcriptional regulator [Bacteroidota bacterium]
METLPQIDQTDRAILGYLQKHAKLTNVQLAQHVGLSPASTLERVKKLERQGIIKGYYTQLDPKQLALNTCVMMQITLHSLTKEHVADFKASMEHIPEVVACYQVIGDADFLVTVITTDIAAYQYLVTHRFSEVKGIRHIKAFVVTATVKEAGIPIISS